MGDANRNSITTGVIAMPWLRKNDCSQVETAVPIDSDTETAGAVDEICRTARYADVTSYFKCAQMEVIERKLGLQ